MTSVRGLDRRSRCLGYVDPSSEREDSHYKRAGDRSNRSLRILRYHSERQSEPQEGRPAGYDKKPNIVHGILQFLLQILRLND